MNLPYDPNVPANLKKTQQWFASIITRPFLKDNQMLPISPSGKPMEEEAKQYISPSPALKPHERIELYNQQYWWRLLSNMHEIYPLVTRLFGYYQFNQQIAIPYLMAYPPTHWSLNLLGSHLAKWINDNYHQKDKSLLIDSAKIDWAVNCGFTTKQLPHLDLEHLPKSGDVSSLLSKKLYLQPHLCLFEFNYDLFAFRELFIKEDGDYWITHDFPKLAKERKYFFVLYRTLNNNISWNEITPGQHHLIQLFKKGSTIEKACAQLEKAKEDVAKEVIENLHKWFQEWIIRRWLSLEKG